MPHFVTDIRHADSAQRAAVSHAASNACADVARAYRRRLASLQLPAPDTLRARVRRELRLARATARTE
jgi:hypothetical protein